MPRTNTEHSRLYMYVRERLKPHADRVFSALLPGGEIQAGLYFCDGLKGGKGNKCVTDLDSLIGCDHGTGTCWGDFIDLGRQLWSCMAEDSALHIADLFGLDVENFEQALQLRKLHELRSEIPKKERICPIPIISPSIYTDSYYRDEITEAWQYTNIHGQILFYVEHIPTFRGGTKRHPVSLYRKINGRLYWYFGGPVAPFPIYNLHKVHADKGAIVLIVRKEEYVHLVEKSFPGMVGTTWAPGFQNMDVEPLRDRSVFILPEDTLLGCAAALTIQQKIKEVGTNAYIINTLDILRDKRDFERLSIDASCQALVNQCECCSFEQFLAIAEVRHPTLRHSIKSHGHGKTEYV